MQTASRASSTQVSVQKLVWAIAGHLKSVASLLFFIMALKHFMAQGKNCQDQPDHFVLVKIDFIVDSLNVT